VGREGAGVSDDYTGNGTNVGAGFLSSTPEEKEIERLERELKKSATALAEWRERCWTAERATATTTREMLATTGDMLLALIKASEFIGSLPSGVLGTQEPAYKTLVDIDRAIGKFRMHESTGAAQS
jgi:hypothetical protein